MFFPPQVLRTVKKRKEELAAMRQNLETSEAEVKLCLAAQKNMAFNTSVKSDKQLTTDVSSDDAR